MKDFVEVPNNNNVCIVQVLIYIKLEYDIINLLTPFLQAY